MLLRKPHRVELPEVGIGHPARPLLQQLLDECGMAQASRANVEARDLEGVALLGVSTLAMALLVRVPTSDDIVKPSLAESGRQLSIKTTMQM